MAFFGFSLLSCHFWPFTGVLRKIFGSLTRKVSETFEQPLLRRLRRDRLERIAVEAAVSAALEKLQAARLPLQNYFGANEATRLRQGYGVVGRHVTILGQASLRFFQSTGRRAADPTTASVLVRHS